MQDAGIVFPTLQIDASIPNPRTWPCFKNTKDICSPYPFVSDTFSSSEHSIQIEL